MFGHRDRDAERKAERDQVRQQHPGAAVDINKATNDQFELEKKQWRERQAKRANHTNPDGTAMDQDDVLISHADDLIDANHAALDNAIRTASMASDIAVTTLAKVNAQTEQMKTLDQNLDATNASLQRSERTIRGMNSFSGYINNLIWGKKQPIDHTAQLDGAPPAHSSASTANSDAAVKIAEREKKIAEDKRAAASTAHIDSLNESDKVKSALKRFDEAKAKESAQLDQLGHLLDNLHGISQDVHGQLEIHDKMIDHLDTQITNTTVRTKTAITGTNKIA